jgi:hypothetical protein
MDSESRGKEPMSVDEFLKKEKQGRWGIFKRFRKNKSKLDEELENLQKTNPEAYNMFIDDFEAAKDSDPEAVMMLEKEIRAIEAYPEPFEKFFNDDQESLEEEKQSLLKL